MIDKLPILTVLQLHNQFDRFVIRDEKNRDWNGEKFTKKGTPSLYADHDLACRDGHDILKQHFVDVQPVRFIVPIFVDVLSREPVDRVDVARYLCQTSRLVLDTSKNGNGPGNSLVLPVIDWRQIESNHEQSE